MNIKNGFKSIGTVVRNNIIAASILGIAIIGTGVTALASNIIGDNSDDNLIEVTSTTPETTVETSPETLSETTVETTSEVESATIQEVTIVAETTGQQVTATSSAANVQETQALTETETNAPNAKFFSYNICSDTECIITKYSGKEKNVIIPSKIDGYNVIGFDSVMCGIIQNDIIETLVIPEGVTTIGNAAFVGCHNLKTVSLPSTLIEFNGGAFSDDYNLTSLRIPENVKKFNTSDISYSIYDKDSNSTTRGYILIEIKSGSWLETYAKNNKIPYTIY